MPPNSDHIPEKALAAGAVDVRAASVDSASGAGDRVLAGGAPPFPRLLIGRSAVLGELKRRLGIGSELRLDGTVLEGLRKQKGITQGDLAEKAGCSKRTIEDTESGRRMNHYRSTIEGIATALGVWVSDLQQPRSAQTLTVMHGLPGVGKSTMAAALAHDPETGPAFPDGVLWTSLGPRPNVFAELTEWGRALGTEDLNKTQNAKRASEKLASLLRHKRVLLIVDDVYESEHAVPFRVGGRGCAMLVTSREPKLADELAPTPGDIYPLSVLDEESALALLRAVAPEVVKAHPDEALALVRELEGLPLALQVAGHLLNVESKRGWDVGDLLRELRHDANRLLRSEAPADMTDLLTQTTPTVAALLRKSTDRLDGATRERFTYLGSFIAKPARFTLADLAAVWNVPETEAKRTANELIDRGLLEPIGDARFWMHALLVMHADSLCQE